MFRCQLIVLPTGNKQYFILLSQKNLYDLTLFGSEPEFDKLIAGKRI
jgi:hypothetical protein